MIYKKKKGIMMKNLIIAALVIAFGIGFTGMTNAQEKEEKKVVNEKTQEVKNVQKTDTEETTAVAKEVKEGKAFNVICPVSTEEIDDPVLVEYKGKVYGVCCKSCLKKFKKDPEKYISRLSEDGTKIVKKK